MVVVEFASPRVGVRVRVSVRIRVRVRFLGFLCEARVDCGVLKRF